MRFIVFHCETGAMDGVYSDRALAEEVMAYMGQRYTGHFLLMEIVAGHSDHAIPDHLFHTDEPMASWLDHAFAK